ncbi:hypothetical protein IJ541_07300 [bacterium]|nr:hypothetical protein [bacterium]
MIGYKYLDRERYSDLGKEVFDRLKKIWDQEDFLLCTMVYLDTEDKTTENARFSYKNRYE